MTAPKEAVEAAVDAMSGVDAFDLRALATDILEAVEPYMLADRKMLAKVLGEHQIKTGNRGMKPSCTCGWLGQVFGNDFRKDFITHQADMLEVALKGGAA